MMYKGFNDRELEKTRTTASYIAGALLALLVVGFMASAYILVKTVIAVVMF